MTETRPPPLDAHVHVWNTRRRRLPWLPSGHPLRRDYSLTDLAEASGGELPQTILVQADADPAEVIELLDLAAATPAVLGVVGWLDLLADDLADQLAVVVKHAENGGARLVGIRCPPADQTDPNALTDPALVRGVRAVAEAGLAVDLLLRPAALIGAARLAAAVPEATLVLDHLGNPATADNSWVTGMRALAEAPGVAVKLSGVTGHLPAQDAVDVFGVALDLFGSDRLLFGSDWPVCTLRTTRAETVRRTTALLPVAAHNDVFRGTAQRVYRLGR
ncbi:L-fuconolactonase [Kribbella orskensis]|uniref:L-fuconolactonase n=1 Tax=Kribbella orskensis TaxID=2512216 RepID=A0ABY2BKE2_9ACTN|nr:MULTISPECIES: amidohydrolase family protein [Kribbella]TCN38297.1 L-fuconolactonase [Kribbella sp. VKM Ac-2500]TCO20173.1 L-fuconolactonase [Kribbella orskensis]